MISTKEKADSWLDKRDASEVGDKVFDNTAVITEISNVKGYSFIKLAPIYSDDNIGAGEGKHLKIEFLNNYSDPIDKVHKIVLEYFNIPSIKEKTKKGQKLIKERNLFFAILLDQYSREITGSLNAFGTEVCKVTGQDRTSFYYAKRLYESGSHISNKKILNDDYVCNHYYRLRQILTGVDQSHKLVDKPHIKEVATRANISRYKKVMKDHSDTIKIMIKRGKSYTEINDRFFSYSKPGILSKELRKNNPELLDI